MAFDEYTGYFSNLENGNEKCKGIKRAIYAALEKQDTEAALRLYYTFVEEDTFYSDGFESFLIFPEYLSCFEAHPEYSEQFKYSLMWCFKWIAGSAEEFWQISLEQLYELYRQYGEYCDKFCYNKRSYYRKLWNLMDNFGLRSCPLVSSVEQAHKLMMHCPLDDLSEIEAGEADDLTAYYIFVEKDIDKAYKAAEQIFSGRIGCNVVPHYTYLNFADYYFEHKDIENAEKFVTKAVRLFNRDFPGADSMLKYKGRCISIMSFYDVQTALKLFRRNLGGECTNGLDIFYFYRGAYHLFSNLEACGQKTVRLRLPDATDPIYKDSGIYQVGKIKEYYYSKAKFVADKFDERDKNEKYNYLLNKKHSFNPREQI